MSLSGQPFETDLVAMRDRVNSRLAVYVAPMADCPTTLRESMAYSLLAGGKRLRPILVLLACDACGGQTEAALPAACAIEMIHTYSLIHDDLPAMDDDNYRRGRLTNHKVFGDGMAILAGDALLTLAFEVMARDTQPSAVAAACCADLAAAAGWCGMVGGQVADLEAERRLGNKHSPGITQPNGTSSKISESVPKREAGLLSSGGFQPPLPLETHAPHEASLTDKVSVRPGSCDETESVSHLEAIHRRKTGRLLCSAVTLGARVAQASLDSMKRLEEFGKHVGLAFQIADDLLDVTGDATKLGKNVGKDATLGKMTYPGLLGVEASRRKADHLIDEACRLLEPFGHRADKLAALARFVTKRDH